MNFLIPTDDLNISQQDQRIVGDRFEDFLKSIPARFWREVRRAKEQGLKLIILVEAGPAVKNINDVVKWKSKYSPVTGRSLIDRMIQVEMAYSVRWVFCSKASTAKRIIELLEGKD